MRVVSNKYDSKEARYCSKSSTVSKVVKKYEIVVRVVSKVVKKQNNVVRPGRN